MLIGDLFLFDEVLSVAVLPVAARRSERIAAPIAPICQKENTRRIRGTVFPLEFFNELLPTCQHSLPRCLRRVRQKSARGAARFSMIVGCREKIARISHLRNLFQFLVRYLRGREHEFRPLPDGLRIIEVIDLHYRRGRILPLSDLILRNILSPQLCLNVDPPLPL